MPQRSWFLAKEDTYPYASANGTAGLCDKNRMAATYTNEKVQLTGRGFRRLRSWSAAALRQVSAKRAERGEHNRAGFGCKSTRSLIHFTTLSNARCMRDLQLAGGAGGARDGWLLGAQGQPV